MLTVYINGDPFEAGQGERLADVLIRAKKTVPMPCGGRGTCGKCVVEVNGAPEKACGFIVDESCSVVLPEEERILSEAPSSGEESICVNAALALDIGTTTLALSLFSLDSGQIFRTVTRANPQRVFGADVMNRIGYCMEHGVKAPHGAVIKAVNEMAGELSAPENLTLYVSGNTTMLHLFFGVDPSSMGTAPYTPVFLGQKKSSGESLGLSGIKKAVSLPGAAAFVGADIIAGLGYIGLPEDGKHRLLIDLGTNAEVVLFSRDSALCTAAAAGPCFEGADISCGMSASPGAVCAFSSEGCVTVDGAPARGVCGTGLVDVIAFLLENGEIDETGFMENESFEIAPGVTLTQGDVRRYQLAKSAVCSAVCTLMSKKSVDFRGVDRVYLSGGFSMKINVENAVKTGLIPAPLKEKCVSSGNTSLLGTVKYAAEKTEPSFFTDRLEYVDLAADPVFSELFINNMYFGET